MPEMRKCIRNPGHKLAQVYKQFAEKDDYALTPLGTNIHISISQSHAEGPLPEDIPVHLRQQFKKLEVGKCVFAVALRDSCCLLRDSEICFIKNIIQTGRHVSLILRQFRSTTEIYNVGVTSDFVKVYLCRNLQHTLKSVPLPDVKREMYMMPKLSDVEGEEERVVENEWICVSLLEPLKLPAKNVNIH